MRHLQDYTDQEQLIILRQRDFDWIMEILTKLTVYYTQPIRVNGPVLDSNLLYIWFEIHCSSDNAFWWSSISYDLPSRTSSLRKLFTLRPDKSIEEIVKEVVVQFDMRLKSPQTLSQGEQHE